MLRNNILRLTITLLAGGALWVLVIYKAIYIPVTHDEVPGPTHYVNFSVWKIMMFPDNSPNNHILNTLFTKFTMYLFGNDQWAVRLPNILFFGVYLFAAYQICNILFKKDNLLFVGGMVLFLCNPFLLDFFSLCRGYGISNGFLLLSIWFVLQAFMYRKEQSIWFGLSFSLLASYANFTLLVFWSAITIMTFLYFIIQYAQHKNYLKLLSKLAILAAGVLAYGAMIYTPIRKMQTTNQFDPWQSNGFFKDTITNLVENTLYGSRMIDIPAQSIAFFIVLIFFISGAVLFYQWGKNGEEKISKTPLFIAFSVLGLTTFVNILQTVLLHTPNLTSRTALFFYPLFCFLIVSIFYHLVNRRKIFTQILSILLVITGIFHLSRTVTLDRVREWWYDANTLQVMNVLEQESKQRNKPILLKTVWLFYPSFDFYVLTGKAPFLEIGEYDKNVDTQNVYDFYYIFNSEYDMLKDKYDILAKYDGGARLLLKRK